MIHRMSRSLRNLILGLGIAFAAVTLAQAAGGVLDPTFSTDGKVTTDFGARGDVGYSMALQTDGRIIIGGGSTDYSPCCTHEFALARYNSDGSLDTGFSGDGKVITGVRDASYAQAVALQPDGKIIAIGFSTVFGGNSDFALVRYNSNGSLDTTFDTDGKVTTAIGSAEDYGNAVALQPDGKIVVAGSSFTGNDYDFALARYNSNGSLDTTFHTDGKVTTDFAGFDDRLLAIAIQPDGRIVAAGVRLINDDYDFALARYNSNGSLDTTFDTDGKLTTDFGFNDTAYAIAIQLDGRIVAAGSSDYNDNFDFALARYSSDGSLDTTFDMDGKVSPDFGSNIHNGAHAVVIQPNGKIVVAGRGVTGNALDFAVMRYNSNGSPDITFDMDGKVTTNFGSAEDSGYAIALGPDGRIVVAGSSWNNVGNYDFALARYIGDELFSDVPIDHWAWSFIERLYAAGITGGCGTSPLQYCPETTVTRSQMAVFLERGIHGSSYSPPAVGASTGFGDVPVDYWSAAWIKQLAAEGITGGCGSGNYCPEFPVTRDQMAVFLLRSKYGSSYSPPAVGGSTGFGDVPTDHWAAPWIKQLVTEGITAGCGSGNYCPGLPVTRAQMAVFLVRTFNLP